MYRISTSFLVPDAALRSWVWRVPFLLGALLGGAGLYIRLQIAETPEFLALQRSGVVTKFPLLEAIRLHRREVFTAMGINVLNAAAFYLVFLYIPTYLSTERQFPRASALILNTFAMGLLCVFTPAFGAISDRLGRKPPQILAAVAYLVLTYPLFRVFSHGGLVGCVLAYSSFAIIHSALCSPTPAMFVEMFPARVRYSSVSFAFNLTMAVLGGTAPLIASSLIQRTGSLALPSFYIILIASVNLAALLTIRETRGQRQV